VQPAASPTAVDLVGVIVDASGSDVAARAALTPSGQR
jgi:hypothetical protein